MSFGRIARALPVGLIVFVMAFLVACADDQDTQATEEPQSTAGTESATSGRETDPGGGNHQLCG